MESELRCTVNEAFMGLMLGDCGKATDTVITYECPKGHVTVCPMCTEHAAVFLSDEESGYEPSPINCTTCYEVGNGRWECDITDIRDPRQGEVEGQEVLFDAAP